AGLEAIAAERDFALEQVGRLADELLGLRILLLAEVDRVVFGELAPERDVERLVVVLGAGREGRERFLDRAVKLRHRGILAALLAVPVFVDDVELEARGALDVLDRLRRIL